MEIGLKSKQYDIISQGEVFLFEKNADLTIKVNSGTDFSFFVILQFQQNESEEVAVEHSVDGNVITINCSNFQKNGTGLLTPLEIAVVENRKLYIMFWAFLYGDAETVRGVKYTIFYES